MRRADNILNQLDWLTVLVYGLMVVLGWLNIYAAEYDPLAVRSIFDLSTSAGKQLLFMGITLVVVIFILALDDRLFETLSYPLWGLMILLLIVVLLVAREVNGARSWIELGPFRFQPAEFAKFATALALARYAGSNSFKMGRLKDMALVGLLVGLPAFLVVLQGDTGTALVFAAFILVLFREGLSAWPLLLGLALAFIFLLALFVEDHIYLWAGTAILAALFILINRRSPKRILLILAAAILISGLFEGATYAFGLLKPHQQNRILVLLNPNIDPLGVGWNVTQSKIAIGSGGITGKGFLNGTQTTFDFVPEQSTDFIFCTIGEEHGWIGSLILISLFMTLLLRIVYLADQQKRAFVRIYGYSVASILFFHFAVNIGMTIGLFPVIGIPLPFFSYGGSSLLAFSILLFIFLALDARKTLHLRH